MFPINTTSTARRDRDTDFALYPHLLDRDWRPRSRWNRLRSHLTGEARLIEDEDTAARAIDHYQSILGRRASMVLDRHARDGWWAGPAPYGYLLSQHRVRDEHGRQVWRRKLAPDPRRAPTVPVIYYWSVHDHLSDVAIAIRLAFERRPAPVDHITGRLRAWSPTTVRTILTNPAYLGHVVRGRTRDGRPQPPERWLWSEDPAHPPLINPELFWESHHRRHQADDSADAASGSSRSSRAASDPGRVHRHGFRKIDQP